MQSEKMTWYAPEEKQFLRLMLAVNSKSHLLATGVGYGSRHGAARRRVELSATTQSIRQTFVDFFGCWGERVRHGFGGQTADAATGLVGILCGGRAEFEPTTSGHSITVGGSTSAKLKVQTAKLYVESTQRIAGHFHRRGLGRRGRLHPGTCSASPRGLSLT